MNELRFLLRSHRRSILTLIAFAAIFGALQSSGYAQVAGNTAEERARFGAEAQALARQLSFLTPLPTDLSTLGGYLTWRVFGNLPLLLGMWAVWFASSTTRGHESAGLIEQSLAAGSSRGSILLRSSVSFMLACTVIVAALCIGLEVSKGSSGSLPVGSLTLQAIALLCALTTVFAVGAVSAQLTSNPRAAFGVGALTTFVFNLVNSLGASLPAMRPIRFLSPFSWYSANQPLASGGSFSPASCVVLLGLAGFLALLALVLFDRRDLGQSVFRMRSQKPPIRDPLGVRWYRHPLLGPLYEERVALGLWMAGMCALVAFFVKMAPSLVTSLQQVSSLQSYLLAISGGSIQRAVIGLFLLGTLQLLLSLFAIAHVSRWARDDKEGRLELELSTPVTRWLVVVRRIASLLLATLGLTVVSMLFLVVLATQQGVAIGVGPAIRTTLLLLPFTLAFAAIGSVLTAVLPRAAVFGLTAFAVGSYFLKEMAPLYGWPAWVLDLSVFHVVGNPLIEPPQMGKTLGLIAITVCGFAAGAVLMRSRDVGS